MKITSTLILLVTLASPIPAFAQKQVKPVTKSVATLGVRGSVSVFQLTPEHVEVVYKTKGGEMRDTLSGKGIIPLMVNGSKHQFYAGRFGNATLPMLIVALRDVDRIQDSKMYTYQLTPGGGMIGQRVVVDEKGFTHSESTSGGRHYLAAIDTKLGAIYSLSYQRASFEGFYHTFEKLRVRQFESSLDAFLETDQGFLRDRYGKIVESSRFNLLNDSQRQKLFVANVMPASRSSNAAKPRVPAMIPVKRASIK
ncbi:MAG TPA: hypothetical protein VFH43_00315 [Candidatus Kapabacteria bacterium]|nr:hypothetical protein [Candidatus Kapabacteria bacterium]